VGAIFSHPESEPELGKSGNFLRYLGFANMSGGIDINGDVGQLAGSAQWLSRVLFHEIAHTRNFFGFTAEQLQTIQLGWQNVDQNPSRVARLYGLTDIYEYTATLVEAYTADTAAFLAQAKQNPYLSSAFKAVVELLKYNTGGKWMVPIYFVNSNGKVISLDVEVAEDGLPVIPTNWQGISNPQKQDESRSQRNSP